MGKYTKADILRMVKEDDVEKHEMHSEHYYIKKEDCDKINETKRTPDKNKIMISSSKITLALPKLVIK